eukprot:617996-Rhodomonas_salina.1
MLSGKSKRKSGLPMTVQEVDADAAAHAPPSDPAHPAHASPPGPKSSAAKVVLFSYSTVSRLGEAARADGGGEGRRSGMRRGGERGRRRPRTVRRAPRTTDPPLLKCS